MTRPARAATWIVLGLAVATVAPARAQESRATFDLLIRGGTLLDGTGAPARRADVAVRGGRIAAVGELRNAAARRVIDADGLVVAPGFIDLHSHADWAFGDPERNLAPNNLTQGITTVVVGQDGRSAWPVGGSIEETTARWISQGIAENVILLVGHGHVRREVMGDDARPPTGDELVRMRRLVRAAMEGGAAGLSTGLSYVPGRFASTDEVIALAREIAPYGGVYISHLRDQGAGLVESVRETARIGREAGITVVATHLKISGRANFGKSGEALDAIEEARRQGIALYADQYPYTTSSNGIDVHFLSTASPLPASDAIAALRHASSEALADLVLASHELTPKMYTREWLLTRPRAELEARAAAGLESRKRDGESRRVHVRALLEDPTRRALLYRAVAGEIARWGGADTYVIERAPDARLEGRTLEEAAATLGVSVPEAAIALELTDAQVTQFHMAEEDVVAILRRDFTATSTDGTVPIFGVGTPHPRSYGAFTRKIRTYVLDRGVLSLPFAIRSMTGLAAEILGLTDRGTIQPGAWADLVVFDLRRIRDRATYREPHRHSDGIEFLFVNGVAVVDSGRVTGARPGRVLHPRGGAAVRFAPTPAAP